MSNDGLSLPPVAGLAFRRESDADLFFLEQLYASTREREMALVPWDAPTKRAFLQMQFAAQRRHYLDTYPRGIFAIVEKDGAPAGRLYLHRSGRELRVIDIAIAPQHRGLGIGSAIMAALLESADVEDVTITIHVERENPALGWYERMGFRQVREVGLYFYMERDPRARPSGHPASELPHAG